MASCLCNSIIKKIQAKFGDDPNIFSTTEQMTWNNNLTYLGLKMMMKQQNIPEKFNLFWQISSDMTMFVFGLKAKFGNDFWITRNDFNKPAE